MRRLIETLLCAAFACMALVVTATAQTPLRKLTWGYTNPSAYYWDAYAAIALGYMNEEGLDVEALNIPSVGQSVKVLLTGDIQILSVNTEVVISAAEKDADIVMVGAETTKPTFALVSRPEYKTYQSLKGKTLGVTQLEEASTTMLKMLMQKNGVGSKDYDIIPTGGTPSRYAALKTGAIAATMLSQSVDFLAQSEGFNLLGYSYEAFDAPLVSIAVQRKWATTNADTLVRFLRATAKASRWLADPANRAQAVAILVKVASTPESDAQKTYDLYFDREKIMSVDLQLPVTGVQKWLDLRGSKEPPSKFMDMSYLARALGK